MLSLKIALRYLLSRKSHGAVNIISAISLAAIAVAAAAMVIVLSVFNGFSQLAESKLSAVDPDFLLVPAKGKVIAGVDSVAAELLSVDGVATVQPEISEQAFAVAQGEHQMPVRLKGMTSEAVAASGLGGVIIDGNRNFIGDTCAIISVGVAMQLNLRPAGGMCDFTVYEPRRVGRINPANPMAGFRMAELQTTGVFQVEQEEYDRDVVIVPLAVAASLLGYDGEATSLCVWLKDGASPKSMAGELAKRAESHRLEVKDRHRQQEAAFRMISIEKWITFLMLAFILVIASCNIISTLSMLILEKEDNMGVLAAVGATRGFINRIFITQGWLIILIGGCVGIVAGSLLVVGQQHFGWIKLAASDPALMSVASYPVLLSGADLLATFLTLFGVALVVTPVIPLIRRGSN